MKSLLPASIRDIFLSEVIPAIEHLSENNFIAYGYPSSKEIPFIKEKVLSKLAAHSPMRRVVNSHSHFCYELCFCVTGKYVINIESRYFNVEAGDICLFAPGVKHFEICTEEKSPYRIMWSSVIPEHVRFAISEFSRDNFIPVGGIDIGIDIEPLLNEIVEEIKNKKYKFFFVIKANFLKFFIEVVRNIEKHHPKHKENFTSWKEKIIEEAADYIGKNITRKLSLGEVSQVLRLSPNYFCTLFSEGAGFSFKDYINKVRVDKAKELLHNSRFTIKEIAELTGFNDPAYFTRVFTQLAGKSPSRYRIVK